MSKRERERERKDLVSKDEYLVKTKAVGRGI
jgi:hypothetical protein